MPTSQVVQTRGSKIISPSIVSIDRQYRHLPDGTRELVKVERQVFELPDTAPKMTQHGERFAYLRGDGLGDVIAFGGVIGAARQAHPEGFHVYYLPDYRLPIFEHQDIADAVIDNKAFRAEAFDQVGDMNWYVEGHSGYFNMDRIEIFAEGIGLGDYPGPFETRLQTTDDEKEAARKWLGQHHIFPDHQKLIVIQGHGLYYHRGIEGSRLRAIVEKLQEDFPVVVEAMPGPQGQEVAAQLEGTKAVMLRDEDIRQKMGVVQQASMLFGPDSGLYHLAAALRVPFVTWFGAIGWWLRCTHYRSFWAMQAQIDCGPCGDGRTAGGCKGECTELMDPDEVVEVIRARLRRRNPKENTIIGPADAAIECDYVHDLPERARLSDPQALKTVLQTMPGSYHHFRLEEAYQDAGSWALPLNADSTGVEPVQRVRKVEPEGRPEDSVGKCMTFDLPPETCMILRDEALPQGMQGLPVLVREQVANAEEIDRAAGRSSG